MSNLGAYVAYFWPLRRDCLSCRASMISQLFRFKGWQFLPTLLQRLYRSAGRPEAIYVIERLIDLAADQCGFDRVELRRRILFLPPNCHSQLQ